MPAATRHRDYCTGHDLCPAVPLDSRSPNVYINGKGAGRVSDEYDVHGCPAHPGHPDHIEDGSRTVYINGLRAGRVGDPVWMGGSVRDGSPNVYIGG